MRQRIVAFLINKEDSGGGGAWYPFFPLDCGLSALENVIDVGGVYIPMGCII